MLKDKLEQHLSRIDAEINNLEKSKNIIMSCLDSMNDSNVKISDLTKQLLLLNKCLEMDDRERQGFMNRQLKRIFPGNFGKLLVIQYAPFFNSSIDSKEKEVAWLNIVKFLDEVETFEYPEEMKEVYENLSDQDMEKIEKHLAEYIKKWIEITDEEMHTEREQIFESINRMNNGDMKVSWQKNFRMNNSMKEQMNNLGYYDKFEKNLKILSSDYQKYTSVMKKFTESLNLKIDDKGKII